MMAFEPRCVCGKDMLTSIQGKLGHAWKDTIWSLASLVAVAIAGGWPRGRMAARAVREWP